MIRDFTFVDDIVEGVSRALDSPAESNDSWHAMNPDPATSTAPYRIYNIGNNKPEVSVYKIFKILSKIYEKKIFSNYIKHPKSYPLDEPQRRCPNINKAKEHLNYKPKVNLENGLKKFLNWAKKNYTY